jgi:hypothetical protein
MSFLPDLQCCILIQKTQRQSLMSSELSSDGATGSKVSTDQLLPFYSRFMHKN